ncbi:MAG: hypothetical protein AB1896_20460 [Thermodesulfobacteriota bacterium]
MPGENEGWWVVPRLWPGRTVYIIGGGPSLKLAAGLPENESNPQVIFPAVSDLLRPIHNQRVIGVNTAYLLGPFVDICYFGDYPWYDFHRERLQSFPGLKVTCSSKLAGVPGVKAIRRGRKGLDLRPDFITWGANTGASAINLALHLGAARIFLLGFDGGNPKAGHFNWHDEHRRFRAEQPPELERRNYQRFIVHGFQPIAEAIKTYGLEVVVLNANPDSAIECFPKVSLEDVLGRGCDV